jgi:hypothetical protein
VLRRSAWLLALFVAGCGGAQASYKNEPRPPAPINVTASINPDRVSVSPKRFGAGPIVITVSNQTGRRQTVTFETNELAGKEGGIRTRTRPIAPRDVTTLQVDVRRGTYALATRERAIEPARLVVGRPRASAQNDLLQP